MKLLLLVVGALLVVSSDAQIQLALAPATAAIATGSAVAQSVSTTLLKECSLPKSTLGVTYAQLANTAPAAIANIQLTIYKTVAPATVPTTTNVLLSNAGTVLQSTTAFDKAKPTMIFVHGFIFGTVLSGLSFVTNALAAAKAGTHNVMAVDAAGSINVDLLKATTYIQYIGEVLGAQMAVLKAGVPSTSIHVIGHGLGAHLASFAGKQYTINSTLKFDRITGLDPFGPCFHDPAVPKLSSNDATFVDVIHTDAGTLGVIGSSGHADFYPNGGSNQPTPIGPIPILNHMRAWEIYVQSVYNSTIFPAVQCSDYTTFLAKSCTNNVQNNMGMAVTSTPTGQFYLRTGAILPLGLGTAGYDLNIAPPTPAVPFPYSLLPDGPLMVAGMALFAEIQAILKM